MKRFFKRLTKRNKMKQAILVRTDLKMGKGKLATQVAHASLEVYKKTDKQKIKKWEEEGSKKIVLKVNSLKELLEYKKKANQLKIPNALIKDAGLTQLKRSTTTCLGLGPDDEEKIDKITKNLKLL
jgi:PTH2 family peptidyl-tRNA hydrolase